MRNEDLRFVPSPTRQGGEANALPLPRNLVAAAKSEGGGQLRRWIKSLPGTVKHLEQHWSPGIGEPFQPGGETAWVPPSRTEPGSDLVLKVVWPHPEAAHEA